MDHDVAAGLVASGGDLVRWTRAVWAGRVLSAAGVRRLYDLLRAPDPPGAVGPREVVAHGGLTMYGFNAALSEQSRSRVCLVVLTNSTSISSRRAARLAQRLEPLVFAPRRS